ncbi:MAG TPA: hypothetical protein VLZ77_13745 [Acidimicrobiales bacterium]|nr:hypothetical protein [Acidimicrobiales bacterium]
MPVTGAAPAPEAAAGTVTAPAAVAVLERERPAEETEPLAATIVVAPQRERRTHRWWPWAVVVLVLALGAAVLVQIGRPLPSPTVRTTLATSSTVTGAAPAMPWPATGEAAVSVPSLGVTLTPGPEPTVPIASLTKIMTAYVTLRDHPLGPDEQGPSVVMSAADQAEAASQAGQGATSVPVTAGEHLSERQLLDGLMVHSANNLADVLARWDAGSVPAFVAKMNAAAAALGMTATHYTDANGLDASTMGSAVDELRVAGAAMAIPTFAAVVDQRSVSLPIAGVLPNYVQSVGSDGIIGVKSGFTQAAMGCLVLAGVRTVGGKPVVVMAAVTGQPGEDPLATANTADLRLIDAMTSGLRQVTVAPAGTRVGTISVPWSQGSVAATTVGALQLLAWPGQVVHLGFTHGSVGAGLAGGARVGTLTARAGPERAVVPVRTDRVLTGPTARWRLTRH